jgi:hypothetical protein
MIKQKIQSLNNTPVDLTYTGLIDPHSVLSIQNIVSSGYAYLGNESVSSSNYGHKLYPGQSFTIELSPNDKLFAVGDSGVSVSIFTLEM